MQDTCLASQTLDVSSRLISPSRCSNLVDRHEAKIGFPPIDWIPEYSVAVLPEILNGGSCDVLQVLQNWWFRGSAVGGMREMQGTKLGTSSTTFSGVVVTPCVGENAFSIRTVGGFLRTVSFRFWIPRQRKFEYFPYTSL